MRSAYLLPAALLLAAVLTLPACEGIVSMQQGGPNVNLVSPDAPVPGTTPPPEATTPAPDPEA